MQVVMSPGQTLEELALVACVHVGLPWYYGVAALVAGELVLMTVLPLAGMQA